MATVEDIKRIIAYKKARLEALAQPGMWIRYTKNMECGELIEFKQSCIDDEIIIEALEKQIPKKPFQACGHNTNRTMNFCPMCGQALDWS